MKKQTTIILLCLFGCLCAGGRLQAQDTDDVYEQILLRSLSNYIEEANNYSKANPDSFGKLPLSYLLTDNLPRFLKFPETLEKDKIIRTNKDYFFTVEIKKLSDPVILVMSGPILDGKTLTVPFELKRLYRNDRKSPYTEKVLLKVTNTWKYSDQTGSWELTGVETGT